MAFSNAVSLANIASSDVLTVDTTNDRVGVASTTPDVTLDVIGIISATSFSGDGSLLSNVGMDTSFISGIAATFSGNVNIGGVLTYEDVSNIDSVGVITAQSDVVISDKIIHLGDTDTQIRFPTDNVFTVETAGTERFRVLADGTVSSGTLGATPGTIAAGSLVVTNSNAGFFSNVGGDAKFGSSDNNNVLFQVNGAEKVRIGTSGQIGLGGANYGTTGQVLTSNGSGSAVTWEDASGGGITTEAQVKTDGQTVELALSTAIDHKVTCSGSVTISVTGGTLEGESHTLRIVNSGIATVGFSTAFLFPSGTTPSLPTSDGAISLLSFTIHRAGTAGIGTQLLTGSSVNYS